MALKVKEIQDIVKGSTFDTITKVFGESGEVFGDSSIAIPVEVEGKEYWAKVSVVYGQIYDTKASKAIDPFVARQAWETEKAIKEAEAEAKAKAKAEKLARKNKA